MPNPVTVQLQLTPADVQAIAAATVEQLQLVLKADALARASSLTVKEFAQQARLSPTRVHALIREGKLEATNPGGGDRRITAAAAARYFAGGKHGNGG